jgi:hypothetical protein
MGDKPIGLIVGRSVSNYVLCGRPVPPGAKIVPCCACGEPVALGSTGQAALATGRGFVFCTPCMERIGGSGAIQADLAITSPELREQLKSNPGLEEKLKTLLRSVRTK